MSLFSSSIRARLSWSFGALAVLLAVVCAIGLWRLAELSNSIEQIGGVQMRVERALGEWLGHTRSNAVRAVVLTHSDDAQLRTLLAPDVEKTSARITVLQKDLEATLVSPQSKALFAAVGAKRKTYLESRGKVLEEKKAGNSEQALALLTGTMIPAVDAYIMSIAELQSHFQAETLADVEDAQHIWVVSRNLLVLVGLLGLLAAFAFGWSILRSVTRPIERAVATTQAVAAGDLTVHIESGGEDEMGQMLTAFAAMTARLQELVGAVAEEARAVADTSSQLAQANTELSHRTETQASTLEETASSMEELTAAVGQNAGNARQAHQLASEAADQAARGGEVVERAVQTMSSITSGAGRISDITALIEGVAFQTNILALNAAVEAARAGEHGRGFAVVAAEVRNLAQRSSTEAKQIKSLIAESQASVRAGAELVDAVGRTMADIVVSARRVSDLMAEIAQASQEQNAGIEQVNTAVTYMEQGVQQNASMVEEAAAATESMRQKANELLDRVSRFKVDGRHDAHVATDAGLRYEPALRLR